MTSERILISAFVITKNESAKIAGCLESLQWVDEIVVVDDFSVDETPEICKSFGVSFHKNAFTSFKYQPPSTPASPKTTTPSPPTTAAAPAK